MRIYLKPRRWACSELWGHPKILVSKFDKAVKRHKKHKKKVISKIIIIAALKKN